MTSRILLNSLPSSTCFSSNNTVANAFGIPTMSYSFGLDCARSKSFDSDSHSKSWETDDYNGPEWGLE